MKLNLDIPDTIDVAADFAPYLRTGTPEERTIEETIVEDYVIGNVHAAAENTRKTDLDAKLAAVKEAGIPDAAAIDTFQANADAQKKALIEAAFAKIPVKP